MIWWDAIVCPLPLHIYGLDGQVSSLRRMSHCGSQSDTRGKRTCRRHDEAVPLTECEASLAGGAVELVRCALGAPRERTGTIG
jgi:hypothetical protein